MSLTDTLRTVLRGRVAEPDPAFRRRSEVAYNRAVEHHLRKRRIRARRRLR